MARKDKYGGWSVGTYAMKAMTGKHIKMATKVTSPSGKTVHFVEKIPKGVAIEQAKYQLKKHPGEF